MRGGRASTVVVVVPVHNEAELLDRCLTALRTALRRASLVGIRCRVSIVLDDCSDASAQIVASHGFAASSVSANAVGGARAHGVESALQALGRTPKQNIWIANTDADSAVPANWIISQCRLARKGADVVVGTVQPDFDDLGEEHRQLWLYTHFRGRPNGHVHGANLGIRASVYEAVGGFRAVREHEDVELVERCRRSGAVIVASDLAEVLTSGRFVGRTPGGYAGYLLDQARSLDERWVTGVRDTPSTS